VLQIIIFHIQRLWMTLATLASPVATPLDATVLMKIDLEPKDQVHSQSRPRPWPRWLHLWRGAYWDGALNQNPKYDSVVWVRIRSKTLIVGTCTSKWQFVVGSFKGNSLYNLRLMTHETFVAQPSILLFSIHLSYKWRELVLSIPL